MKTHSYDTLDREYLAELIEYFPVSPAITLDQASKRIQDNCQSWDPHTLIESLEINTSSFKEIRDSLPNILHVLIFDGILSNAGSYRAHSDINKGHVEFGLPAKKFSDGSDSFSSRFSGVNPFDILIKVDESLSYLKVGSVDKSIDRAAKFYQQFVRIHPFYDGNGRIGRTIVDMYLLLHNSYVDWEGMKRNNRWIRQLNYCHRKMTKNNKAYPFALKCWGYYFGKYVYQIPNEKIT